MNNFYLIHILDYCCKTNNADIVEFLLTNCAYNSVVLIKHYKCSSLIIKNVFVVWKMKEIYYLIHVNIFLCVMFVQ